MKEWAIQIINTYGYWGILLLTTLESIFPIVPTEIILTLGGFMTTYTEMTRLGVIVFATSGELLGAITLYFLGRKFDQDRIDHFVKGKVARFIRINIDDIKKAKDFFTHNGKYTVLFCRCIPVLGSLISLPAGMAQMDFIPFILLTMIGITIWNTVLVSLGIAAKTSWEVIAEGTNTVSTIIAYIFIIFVLVNVFLLYRKHKKTSTKLSSH